MGLTFRLFRKETTQTPFALAVDNKPLTKMNELPLKADLIPAVIVKPYGANVKALWPPEVQSLVNWFMELEPLTEPFYLEPHIRVIDPDKYFKSLRREIAMSSSCPRGRNGALIYDLKILRKIIH